MCFDLVSVSVCVTSVLVSVRFGFRFRVISLVCIRQDLCLVFDPRSVLYLSSNHVFVSCRLSRSFQETL
ncbi:hypothetical protein HanPSC8_Chr16g0707291 [Helianthus annuus]|nr:hypothetical protein HanPSC8_Chr16g0707291 [Helianthus annuus]